jgi:hypothetical protein
MAVVLLADLGRATPKKVLAPRPFHEETRHAGLVLYGTALPPVKSLPGDYDCPFLVREVLKGQVALGEARVIELHYAIRVPSRADKVIVFCNDVKGKITPSRCLEVTSPDVLDYVKGLVALPDGSSARGAAHFVRYLGHASATLADDAYRGLCGIDYKHLRESAKAAPAGVLARLITDPNGWYGRNDLYALLLGHCGGPEHVKSLRKLAADDAGLGRSVKGALEGCTLLRPAAGMAALKQILHDPTRTLTTRYSALYALDFFMTERPDVVPQADLVAALGPALGQLDLADVAVDYVRKWRRWELAKRILLLWGKTDEAPSLRRTIIQFALASPHPDAAAFVQRIRREAPDELTDAEEGIVPRKLPRKGDR